MHTERSSAERVDELAEVLQNVVCRPGLVVAALVGLLPELEPLVRLDRVQASVGQDGDEVAVAAAVVTVVSATVEQWHPCPSRTACERLLGIGSTRGMARRDRRRAAREVLGVGEEHFRKKRERDLLRELAAEILVGNGVEGGPGTPTGGRHDGMSGARCESSRYQRRKFLS